MCYKTASYDSKKVIKDIVVQGDKKSSQIPAPYGYVQIEGDLNKGAKGEFIYLFTLA